MQLDKVFCRTAELARGQKCCYFWIPELEIDNLTFHNLHIAGKTTLVCDKEMSDLT